MLSSIRLNQPYANEPVYILEHQWPLCWMADYITTARIVRGRGWDKSRVDSTTAHHHRFTGVARSINPCRWRHRLGGHVTIRRCPGVRWLRHLRGNDQSGHVGRVLVTGTEHGECVTEGVRFDGWTKIANPTNGDLVLVIIIRRRRRRQQLPWRGGWLFRRGRPPRHTCHEHLL